MNKTETKKPSKLKATGKAKIELGDLIDVNGNKGYVTGISKTYGGKMRYRYTPKDRYTPGEALDVEFNTISSDKVKVVKRQALMKEVKKKRKA